MVKKVLLDTNVLIDHLRVTRKGADETVTEYQKLKEQNVKCFVAGLTVAELWAGQSTKEESESKRVRKLLKEVKVELPTEKIYEKAGIMMRDEQPIGTVDAVIASTAIVNKMPLYTSNKRHFEHIGALELW
jgi:predicted nucleic acid-binding protein